MGKFSVLMSVYKNENPVFFQAAMESVLNQTVRPDEIILIRDGVVPQVMQEVINKYIGDVRLFTYIPLEKNEGLGNALRIGVEKARNELIARMDTDDIAVKERFALELQAFEDDPDLAVVGGQIEEFTFDTEHPIGKRAVPLNHQDIIQFSKIRNPFNHMSVMFRRSQVLRAGNYQHLQYAEDYYLWCRMALYGCKFCNLPETLVYARVGSETYRRRGGYQHFKSWYKLEKFKLRHHLTNFMQYTMTLTICFVVQVLIPNVLRGWLFQKYARKPV